MGTRRALELAGTGVIYCLITHRNQAMTDSSPAPATLRIDFVSDVVCPWCAIGLASLQQALQRLEGEVSTQLHVHPFELNPQLPPEGEDIGEHLQRKYGLGEAQLADNQARIRERGAELGVVLDMDARSRIWNTFDAHRLLHWAGVEGKQVALKQALLHGYFGEGRNVSDRDTLVAIASSAGLDGARARTILETDEFADEVREAEQFFLRNGINAVPAVIIDRKHLISGGQPVEVFERALREIAARGDA